MATNSSSSLPIQNESSTNLTRGAAPMAIGGFRRREGGGVAGAAGAGGATAGVAGAGAAATATPAAKPPLYKRRWFKIVSVINAAVGIALLFIVLFPVVAAIAQLIIDKSVLHIEQAEILNPQNNSFGLNLTGLVTHTGIFNAKITFTEPINISWVQGDQITSLGSMTLSPLSAKHHRSNIQQLTTFTILNETAMGEFTAAMITQQNFTWRLTSNKLKVAPLKFPVAHNLKFKKTITLNGINNFNNNVKLENFMLPSDAPQGGINFVAETGLNNPSPFKLDLGTLVFGLSFEDVFLGSGSSTNTVISHGPNNITLSGVLVPQSGSQNLSKVSTLFTQYINGELSPVVATGEETLLPNNSVISWLTQGLKELKLNVPFQSPEPISPIKAISIGEMTLAFNTSQPWAPLAQSNSVTASVALPFGFNLAVNEIENSFNISRNDGIVAGLSTPLGASTSSISVFSSTNTSGTIDISIDNNSLSADPQSHANFASFNALLTDSETADFQLIGHARTIANTSIGAITLDPINFNVTSSLLGLRGLNGLTDIQSIDVVGGTSQGLQLAVGVTIFNPSNLNLDTGDLTLQLQKDGSVLGTTLLPNLKLNRGNNTLNASAIFQANANQAAMQTLNSFVARQDVPIQIAGAPFSTQIDSLVQAFETLNIGATLPGLTSFLLDSGSLEVLPTTGHANNITNVNVKLANPFTAALDITQITTSVTSFGINLGSINTQTSFHAPGKQATSSPALPLNLNLDPPSIFTVTRQLAVEAGLDTEQLDGIVQIGGYQYLPINTDTDGQPAPSTNSTNQKRANIFTGFNLPNFVDAAFKQLRSDVQLNSQVTIGDYTTNLQYTQTDLPISTDSSLNLLLPILAQPIVQKIVSASILGIDHVLISNIQEESFQTALSGSITNAGPFDANITFPEGLTVSWSGKPIGTIAMDPIGITGDVGGTFNVTPVFQVADVNQLTEFSKALLTEESFEWTISGNNLSVAALGITVPGITFGPANVNLKGFNGLKNGVKINSFNLPANDPAGGIHLTIDSSVTNPSQVGISLDSLTFLAFGNDTQIGIVSSNTSFTLPFESTIELGLAGRLIPQTSQEGLSTVATIFNNFIHGMDSAVSVHGQSAEPSVSWLNNAIPSLQVATTLPNQGVLDIIKSITLEELQLLFSTGAAFDPPSGSNATTASFTLPFALPIDITSLSGTFVVGADGVSIAELDIPNSPATTDVESRIINLQFHNVPFDTFGDKHTQFEQFLAAVTTSANQTLHLSGSTNVQALTGVGTLPLTDIAFSVDTSIAGLQGLNARPTTVGSLDVNHGFPTFLLITTSASIFNPSNLTIGTGDVQFNLVFEGQDIGQADISNLIIIPGAANYSTDVHYAPQGSAVAAGQTLLENFISGISSSTTIAGSIDSTPIESLQLALSQITLSPVIIPGINVTLITSTSLTFPTNIVQTGIAEATFTLADPFTASLNLLVVTATATFRNITLGIIDHVDRTSDPIHADGHSTITSPQVPFKFNLQPAVIIELLLDLSQESGVSLGPLPGLFALGEQNPNLGAVITTTVDTSSPTCVSGQQFDVNDAILNALKALRIDLAIDTSLKIDDFPTDLSFNQSNVPAVTDDTALFLIGAVAPPIVQALVNQANLTFNEALIDNITEQGFGLSLKGSLTNIGPLDAEIAFTEPVIVTWEGHDIATINLPSICAAANSGVPDYETNAQLTITDVDEFTAFSSFLLLQPSFTWTIHTDKLRVTALGTIFDNVTLSKDVSFKAFNGLPGVMISNFQLPGDVDGGIEIETDSTIPSPSQLGIDLGTVDFNSFFQGVLVGPLEAHNLDLAPESVTSTHLSGHIVPQTGSDLDVIGTLFSNFLQGKNQTLNVQGVSITPPGQSSPVQWLSTAFKSLIINVTLPGQKFTIIQSITLDDFEVVMTTQDEAFAPLASSQTVAATYKNPFGFSLQVIQSGENITLGAGGTPIASLQLPIAPANGGVSTGNIAPLDLSFSNIPLVSLNNGAFEQLFAAVTDTNEADFELSGTANVVAKTTIGNVPISGIRFDVPSGLKGINSFGGTTKLSNVTITGSGGNGGDQFIVAPLTTELNNPSNVSLSTVDISLDVVFEGVTLGQAVLNTFNLTPGDHDYAAEFHYNPANPNDTTAQNFLTEFLQSSDNLPLTVQGDSSSSPFASLEPALEGVKLQTSLTGMDVPPIITHINVFISLETLIDNQVEVNFDLANPLDTDLVIELVQSDAKVNGETFARFTQPFSSFVVPAHGTANSGTFPHVLLTQGALASLPIIPLGFLDISAASTVRVGERGYEIPWLHLQQNHVPTDYDLGGLSLTDIIGILTGNSSVISSALGDVSSVVSGVVGGASSVVSEVTSVIGGAGSAVGSIASDAGGAVTSVVGGLTSVLGGLTDGPKATATAAQSANPAQTVAAQVSSIVQGLPLAAPDSPKATTAPAASATSFA